MASPVTAGVAAVIRSYYPNLTAKQVKKILEKSVDKDYKNQKVTKPGEVIYIVKKGDSVKSISSKFKMTEQELIQLNPKLSGGVEKDQELDLKVFVKFSDLSTTGGVVNLYNAILLAEKMSK